MPRRSRPSLIALLGAALAAGPAAGADIFDGGRGGPPSPQPAQAPAALEAAEVDARVWIEVPAASADERSRVADAGVSIEEVGPATVAGIADPVSVSRLRQAGVSILRQSRLHEAHPAGFPKPDEAFHDYGEVVSELGSIASANPGLVSLLTVGSSLEGRKILGLRFNPTESGDSPSRKPGIVFLGTHHAREHLSTEVPLLFARWLADNKSKPNVKALLDSRDIYIIPLVNPDGSEYDVASSRYRWHRKNMRKNSDGSTGVDLNRNYGFGWGGGGASSDPGSDTYRGPSAFSEPEIQAVKAFVEARQNLKILLTYHTFSELILYPWGHTHDPIPDGKALAAYQAMASKMAGWTGYTPEQSSDLYIASGDTTDWAWGARKIYSFTFELTPKSMWDGGFYPGAAAIATTFAKNIDPALYLIDLADDPGRAAGSSAAATPKPAPLKPLSLPATLH